MAGRSGLSRGNRECCQHCRNGRCPCRREGSAAGGSRGPIRLAGRVGGGNFARRAGRGVFRRRGGEIAKYVLLRPAPHRGASVAYSFGYGGYCGIVGFGLFVGKGETFARLERDGRGAGRARGAIRISLGWNSRREDCGSFVEALERTLRQSEQGGTSPPHEQPGCFPASTGWFLPLTLSGSLRCFIGYSTTSEPAVLETAKVRRMAWRRSRRPSIA